MFNFFLFSKYSTLWLNLVQGRDIIYYVPTKIYPSLQRNLPYPNSESFNLPPKSANSGGLAIFIYSLIAFYSLLTTFDAVSKTAIAGSCGITNVTGVSFGSYDVFNASATDAVGSVTYRCIDVGTGLITIDLNKGNSNSYNSRTLKSGDDALNYNLYLDSGKNIIWGNGTESSSHYGPLNPTNNSDVMVSIYGRIPAQQTRTKSGNYSDTITITIFF
jgi:spore coat protein U-like protein